MQTKEVKFSPVNIENRKKVDIKTGDTVKVWQKVEEKGKIRLQPFEGIVLSRKHGNEPGATFTVRRVSGDYGVEKIFPLYSPMIDKIEITKRAKVRRAKLYHIRKKAAREIRRQMRNMLFVNIATESDEEEKKKLNEAEGSEEKETEQKDVKSEKSEKSAQEEPKDDEKEKEAPDSEEKDKK